MKIALSLISTAILIGHAGVLAHEPVAAKHGLTLDGAKRAAEAAAAFAKANGASPSIAVVDEGGHLLYFTRSEDSFAAGANVSIGKAHTAAIFKKPTREFEESSTKAASR